MKVAHIVFHMLIAVGASVCGIVEFLHGNSTAGWVAMCCAWLVMIHDEVREQ